MNLKDILNFITSLADIFNLLNLLSLVVLCSVIPKAKLENSSTPWPHVHQSSEWSSYSNLYSEEFGPTWYEGDGLKISPEKPERRLLTATVMTPQNLSPEEFQIPQTQNFFGQDIYDWANNSSKTINSSHSYNPSISRKYNTSSAPSVTHSYFSLGDSSQWWYIGEDEVNQEGKDASIRYRGATKFKDSLEPRPYPKGSLTRPHRQKNYGAFVSGDLGYSVKSRQHDLSNENIKRPESYTGLKIGTPVLQKEPKDPIKKVKASAKKERKMYNDLMINRKFTRNRKNLLRTKVIKNKISRSYRDGLNKPNIGAHGRRSSEPHPGFFRDRTPDCALLKNRTFCFMDETYPRDFMTEQLMMQGDILQRLWRPYSPPASIPPKSPSSSAPHSIKVQKLQAVSKGQLKHPYTAVGYPCPSKMEQRTLSQAKNTRGKWKMIVNVEALKVGDPHLLQTTTLEECTGVGSSCNLLPKGLATSRCVQRYTIHNLLTWDRRVGFYVDSYELPTACVCYVSYINVSLIKSYIGDWK